VARYSTSIRTPLSEDDAFAYMSDLRNFENWDPGVQSVTQVEGEGGGPGTSFDVVVNAPGSGLTLRYTTTHFDPPRVAVVEARSKMFTSTDRIEVVEENGSTVVTYDAVLELNGALSVFDLALRPFFDRIGNRANNGLIRVLDGQPV